jgi:hypothetical protein
MDAGLEGLLIALVWAVLYGLLAAVVVYILLLLINAFMAIAEPTRRMIAALVGALVGIIVLLDRL